ncbi:MAG: hypothetical protein MJZ46_02710 [Bacteroidales bacterium]|nr:hypothetical protein [Bacteroidales bacterium]
MSFLKLHRSLYRQFRDNCAAGSCWLRGCLLGCRAMTTIPAISPRCTLSGLCGVTQDNAF